MEKNTTCIGIEEYNRLRDFEKSIMSGDIGHKTVIDYYGGGDFYFYKENEVVTNLNKHIKSLDNIIKELREPKSKDLPKEAKMSLWEFYKWRKGMRRLKK